MLSKEVEQAVEHALQAARERRQEFATVEHLCLALFDTPRIHALLSQLGIKKAHLMKLFSDFIDSQESMPESTYVEVMPSLGLQRVLQRAAIHVVGAGKQEVKLEHVLVAAFDEEECYAVYLMQQAGISRLDVVSVIAHGADDFGVSTPYHEDYFEEEKEESLEKSDILHKFTTCLTEEARLGRLDQVIGRDVELGRMMQVLSRRRKNNPLLVGEPGVGKTALAEGLAQRIAEQKVPDYLKDCEMFLLDMGSMLAGTRYRGDFENRMKSILKSLEAHKNPILVVDEIHTVIGAGATTGSSMDASNLLKPVLSKGQIRCIGSTTYKEYRAHFEKDRALARRFQKIDIDEPSDSDCLAILQGIKARYESFHDVVITDDALKASVELSKRYLHERKLPDKAIDLIDEACAQARLLGTKATIDAVRIEEAVATMAHIPSRQISVDDKEVLKNLEATLKSHVFGQDEAISKVTQAIIMARAGLRDKEKPIGSYLFSGPSGVGKTEVARKLAESLGVSLIRFDMSEYMERHAVSRLVGAPPGYVGFEQGGLLTDSINKNPYAVLLLDEIEKAHPDAFNMLLQVMDYGKLTDSNGRTSDFRHVILIMTSNVGARELEGRSIGFFGEQKSAKDDKAVKRLFSVEFRNRLDAQITFNKLHEDVMIKVVEKYLNELQTQLAEKNVHLEASNEAKKYLATAGFSPTMGARPLARVIDECIKKPIAQELVFGSLARGGVAKVSVENDKLVLNYTTD